MSCIAVFMLGCSKVFKTGYLRRDINILDSEGAVAGRIYTGSYVKSGSIVAWAEDTGILYRGPHKELEYGEIFDESILEYTGEIQNGLKEALINTPISMNNLSPELDDVVPESEELYYEYCSTCHAAPDLTKTYNVHMKSVMNSMVSHSNVSEEEAKILNRYINLKIVQQ
ncbi:MAG: hypothetical protein AB7E76_00010 [Deferribacterales bacterium]